MALISAIILLGILIFVHELGHFLFAKLMAVKVLKFSLGLGPKVLGRKFGETEYLISAIPFGGYVKMLGEEHEEPLDEKERARAYSSQPVWKRFVIVLSGPLFNIFFAAMLFIFIFINGVPALYPDVGEVMQDMPASKANIQKGDRVIKINGTAINQWDEMTGIIHNNPGRELEFTIKRNDGVIDFKITPEKKTVKNIFGEEKEIGLIGIKPLVSSTFIKHHSLTDAVAMGIIKTYEASILTVIAIVKLIQRIIPANTIGGPILILQMAGEQASEGALNFFTFMAIMSINLGVLNLLPIPVLDGGHLAFLSIEAIRRKPIGERTMMIAQRVGITLLIALMAFAIYNDILRLITGERLP